MFIYYNEALGSYTVPGKFCRGEKMIKASLYLKKHCRELRSGAQKFQL